MLTKLTTEKQMKFLCLLCCIAYFMSYLTRLNYAACMVELQDVLQITKSVAGLPVTACFLSYGFGQIICGVLGDRFKPQMMIFAGLAGACCCNLLVACFPRVEIITPVWCANGFFQAMLWPPMVRIMAECLNDKWYKNSCVLVSMASSAATIATYLVAPVCIQVSGWRAAFFLPAGLGILAAFFWYGNTRKLAADGVIPAEEGRAGTAEALAGERKAGTMEAAEEGRAGTAEVPAEEGRARTAEVPVEEGKARTAEAPAEEGKARMAEAPAGKKGDGKHSLFIQLIVDAPLVLILLAIVLQGMLRGGITTWMPVYMSETFGMSNAKSILSAAALPLFSVFSVLLASLLLDCLKSEVFTAACLFGLGALAGAAMLAAFDSLPVFCILMMTLITGCAHGINLMLISRVPRHFTRYGKVSSVSGILNSATYVGSSLSTYGFGAVAEQAGWMQVVIIWIAVCAAGMCVMFLARKKWARFCGR